MLHRPNAPQLSISVMSNASSGYLEARYHTLEIAHRRISLEDRDYHISVEKRRRLLLQSAQKASIFAVDDSTTYLILFTLLLVHLSLHIIRPTSSQSPPSLSPTITPSSFLADRTYYGRAYATMLRLSVCRLSSSVWNALWLNGADRKSYMTNRLVPKRMTLTFV